MAHLQSLSTESTFGDCVRKVIALIGLTFSGSLLPLQGQTLYIPNGSSGIGTASSSNNVGIGIASPTRRLAVAGDGLFLAENRGILIAQDSNGGGRAFLLLDKDASNGVGSGSDYLFLAQESTSASLLSASGTPLLLGSGSAQINLSTNGNVGIGTATPIAKLHVQGAGVFTGGGAFGYTSNIGVNNGLILGTAGKATAPSGGQGSVQIFSNDASNQLQSWMTLFTDATATNRRLAIGVVEQNVAWRNITLAELGGNVGVGTTSPSHKLSVNGTIRAKEIIVDSGWADHVFADDYRLAPLAEVEAHIKEHRHLPGIPSAAEVAEQGVSLGEIQTQLLAKLEELTLHLIAQDRRLRDHESRIAEQQSELASLRSQLTTD